MPAPYNLGIDRPSNLLQLGLQGYEQARGIKQRNNLQDLMGDYYGKQDPLLGDIARNGGNAGAMQQDQAQQQERLQKIAIQHAGLLAVIPQQQRPLAWPKARQELLAAGFPPESLPEQYVPEIDAMVTHLSSQGGGIPAGVQEYKFMAQGLSPEDDLRARRVALGLEGRASSAGIKFGEMQMGDMKTYATRQNPRTGGMEALTDNGWQPLGGEQGMDGGAPAPSGGPSAGNGALPDLYAFVDQAKFFGGRPTSGYRSQAEQDALIAQGKTTTRSSQHTDGTGVDMVFPNANAKALAIQNAKARGINVLDEGNHVHFGIPRATYQGGGLPSVASPTPGQIKADETRGGEQAKVDVMVDNADVVRDLEARLAAAKAEAEAGGKARGEVTADNTKRGAKANRVLSLLDEADQLIDGSTGSGIGAQRDAAAAYFGQSTAGADNIAALRTINGQLIAEMPRMEGPQSDADRLLYQQAAGDLANPKLPVSQRKAASARIRRLQEKYASNAAAPAHDARQALLDKY